MRLCIGMVFSCLPPTISKRVIALAICLVGLPPIAACSHRTPTAVSPAVEEAQSTRPIAHAMGSTQVVGNPSRVVALTNEATDIALALGATPVGAVKSWSSDSFNEYLAADMTSVELVGDELQPNLEKIAALKPDLILGSKVRQAQVYSQLSAIAPTVFSETLGFTWKENLRLYADALGRSEQADALIADWEQRTTDFKQRLGDQTLEVSLVRFMPGAARTYYKNSFPGQILSEVGLARPEAQDKDDFAQEISLEQISQMDGDVLFYFVFGGVGANQAAAAAQPWLTHPLWRQLNAVEQGRVYAVSDAVWTASSGIQAANLLLDDLYTHLGL